MVPDLVTLAELHRQTGITLAGLVEGLVRHRAEFAVRLTEQAVSWRSTVEFRPYDVDSDCKGVLVVVGPPRALEPTFSGYVGLSPASVATIGPGCLRLQGFHGIWPFAGRRRSGHLVDLAEREIGDAVLADDHWREPVGKLESSPEVFVTAAAARQAANIEGWLGLADSTPPGFALPTGVEMADLEALARPDAPVELVAALRLWANLRKRTGKALPVQPPRSVRGSGPHSIADLVPSFLPGASKEAKARIATVVSTRKSGGALPSKEN